MLLEGKRGQPMQVIPDVDFERARVFRRPECRDMTPVNTWAQREKPEYYLHQKVGVKRGEEVVYDKGIHASFQTLRRVFGIDIPKPFYEMRYRWASNKAEKIAARLNMEGYINALKKTTK